MWKTRLLWAFWLIGAGLLYLFTNNFGTLVILIASFLLPLIMAVPVIFTSKNVSADFTIPLTAQKKKDIECELNITNKSLFPVLCGECTYRFENIMTGECIHSKISFSVKGKKNEQIKFQIVSEYCGKVAVTMEKIQISDMFGLIAANPEHEKTRKTLVMPETFTPELNIVYVENSNIDSDEYSMVKPGSDSSETFAIREYMPGDPIRSIHWKLSQKSDNLMIREFGLPITKGILILLETTVLSNKEKLNGQKCDVLVEVFISLSKALTEQGIKHQIGYKNVNTRMLEVFDIKTLEDLSEVLNHILSTPFGIDKTTVVGSYMSCDMRKVYEHVIVVTPCSEPDIAHIYKGNRVTELICSGSSKLEGFQDDGTFIIPYKSHSYTKDLSYIEV